MEQKDKSDVCIWRMTTTSDNFQIQMFLSLYICTLNFASYALNNHENLFLILTITKG